MSRFQYWFKQNYHFFVTIQTSIEAINKQHMNEGIFLHTSIEAIYKQHRNGGRYLCENSSLFDEVVRTYTVIGTDLLRFQFEKYVTCRTPMQLNKSYQEEYVHMYIYKTNCTSVLHHNKQKNIFTRGQKCNQEY